jgi:hypothetical protein
MKESEKKKEDIIFHWTFHFTFVFLFLIGREQETQYNLFYPRSFCVSFHLSFISVLNQAQQKSINGKEKEQ